MPAARAKAQPRPPSGIGPIPVGNRHGRLAPLMSSERGDWQTPDEVLARVRAVAPIALDPCTTAANPCGARAILVPPAHRCGLDVADGVEAGWDGLEKAHVWSRIAQRHGGLIYCNPPYGRDVWRWLEKCVEAGWEDEAEVIALVPARTDTKWWQSYCSPPEPAYAVCFWAGRLTFRGAPSPAPFPSALVYWGTRRYRFADAFASAGRIWL
jgi:hypothetical protein